MDWFGTSQCSSVIISTKSGAGEQVFINVFLFDIEQLPDQNNPCIQILAAHKFIFIAHFEYF